MCSASPSRSKRHAQQRPRAEVEGTLPPPPAPAAALPPPAPPPEERQRSTSGSASGCGGAMTCTGWPSATAKCVRSTSWRRTNLGQALCQRGPVERAAQADADGDVVEGGARLQLVDEPEPLLRERERQRSVSCSPVR